jgi:hypothetical protein
LPPESAAILHRAFAGMRTVLKACLQQILNGTKGLMDGVLLAGARVLGADWLLLFPRE